MADEAAAEKLSRFKFSEILHSEGRRIAVIECRTCETSYAVPEGKHAAMLTKLIVSIHKD